MMTASPSPLPKYPKNSAHAAAYSLGLEAAKSLSSPNPPFSLSGAPLSVRLAYIQGRVDAQMRAKGAGQ